MPKCSFMNCKNVTSRTSKKDGISYFRFPRDPMRREEWTAIISQQRRQDFYKPNNASVVCSEHFLDEDMYVTENGIKRLQKTAVPRVNDEDDIKMIEITIDGGDAKDFVKSTMLGLENKKELISPRASLSVGPILESPQEVLLKNELNKCQERLASKDKIINNLRKKNSRLLKKAILQKNALKVLKKKLKSETNLCQNLSAYINRNLCS